MAKVKQWESYCGKTRVVFHIDIDPDTGVFCSHMTIPEPGNPVRDAWDKLSPYSNIRRGRSWYGVSAASLAQCERLTHDAQDQLSRALTQTRRVIVLKITAPSDKRRERFESRVGISIMADVCTETRVGPQISYRSNYLPPADNPLPPLCRMFDSDRPNSYSSRDCFILPWDPVLEQRVLALCQAFADLAARVGTFASQTPEAIADALLVGSVNLLGPASPSAPSIPSAASLLQP